MDEKSNTMYLLQRHHSTTLEESKKENEAYSSQLYEWRRM